MNSTIAAAARHLLAGGVIAYPTETVFGLGCLPDNPQALERLFDIKQRPVDKGLILLAASRAQLEPWTADLSDPQWAQISKKQPRATSWIVVATTGIDARLTGNRNAIAIRVTSHPVVQQLCEATGSALVSTSANLSGAPPARSAGELPLSLRNQLDFILDEPCGDDNRPSRIIDLETKAVLRD